MGNDNNRTQSNQKVDSNKLPTLDQSQIQFNFINPSSKRQQTQINEPTQPVTNRSENIQYLRGIVSSLKTNLLEIPQNKHILSKADFLLAFKMIEIDILEIGHQDWFFTFILDYLECCQSMLENNDENAESHKILIQKVKKLSLKYEKKLQEIDQFLQIQEKITQPIEWLNENLQTILSKQCINIEKFNQKIENQSIQVNKRISNIIQIQHKQTMQIKCIENQTQTKRQLNSFSKIINDQDKFVNYIIEQIRFKKCINSEKNKFQNLEAGLLYDQNKFQQSNKEYEKTLKLFISTNKVASPQCANTLYFIGKNYDKIGKKYEAMNCYQLSLKIFENQSQEGSKSNYKNIISDLYFLAGQYTEALKYCLKNLEIYENSKEQNKLEYANELFNVGVIHRMQGNYAQGLSYLKRSYKIYCQQKGEKSMNCMFVLDNMGLINLILNNYTQAINCFEKSLKLKEVLIGINSIKYAECLNNIGKVYFKKQDFRNAFEYYKKSVNICENIRADNSIFVSNIYKNIGDTSKQLGKGSEAIKYYNRCLKIREVNYSIDNQQIVNEISKSIAQILAKTEK